MPSDIVIPDNATDAGAVDVQASEVKSGTAVDAAASATAADATFVAAIPIADVLAIAAPSAVKILTTMLADDDPAFIGQLIQHSSSEISKTSFPVDNLANAVNTVPKTVRPSTVSTSTVSMIMDDSPIFNARAAIEPFLMKVALQWRCAMCADQRCDYCYPRL